MPRARSIGRNGEFAALKTNAASGRRPAIAWIAEKPVWLSVSSCFCGTAGRCTTSMPRYVVSRLSEPRVYTVTRWPRSTSRRPTSSTAVSNPPYAAGTPRVPIIAMRELL